MHKTIDIDDHHHQYMATIITIIIFLLQFNTNSAANTSDLNALLSFASAVSFDPQNALSNWTAYSSNSTDIEICQWYGITCHKIKKRVVQLVLSDCGLHGFISPAISGLSFLAVLDLSGNFFTGKIPPEIGSLSRLKQLSLSTNLLSGSIPNDVGLLHELVYLDLGSNKLSGDVPTTLFCNCTSLQYVDLSNNSLSGTIPLANECRLADLRFLLLWSNRLQGKIPSTLSNSSMLQWIDFENNFLSGELPYDVFNKMPYLQYLYLSYNRLQSHKSNTNLSPFLNSLRNCSHLQELELAGNGLGGQIPEFIGDLSINLVELHLDQNMITGPIPMNISNLVNLTYLNLSYNNLSGSIPHDLTRMRKLERVYLSNNLLEGEIPTSLAQIPRLGLVDLSANRLTGSIPDSLCNLSQLRRLNLGKNQLSGRIPASLGNCINLEILDLSQNRLTGRIPIEVAALSSLKLYLNLSRNLLQGPIPMELSKMDMILALDLSSNNFSGIIPPQLGSCIALEYLNLSSNSLQGSLPNSVGALPYLKVLDLSFNDLKGGLPESLQASSSLKQLNISFNDFFGIVPNVGVFTSLTANSFLGNPGLCGSILGLSSCQKTKKVHRTVALPLLLSLVGISCIIVLLAYLRKSRPCNQLPMFRNQVFINPEDNTRPDLPRITYKQLFEATEGFAESSLIGIGTFGHVYKGVLHDKTRVAVKVLEPKCGIEISGSFKRECQVLKTTRHRNLIRVITACSKPDFKALVLPLMTNGSLEDLLYTSNSSGPSLDLIQMVNIMSDIAEGMAYLHHYAPVRVVHCDLKPSNVLLDENMTAMISDFGISSLVKEVDKENIESVCSSPCSNITGLLQGSVGYIAPEYGLGGRPSSQGDVYSFGVVILEMITGKRPTDVIFHEGLTLHDWVKSHYPGNIDVLISQLPVRESQLLAESLYYKKLKRDSIIELVELGLVCTQMSPSTRPAMINVAHEIATVKQDLSRYGIDYMESCSTPDSFC